MHYYDEKQIRGILADLHIEPVGGEITVHDVAAIYTWRAEHEYQVPDVKYTNKSVQHHVNEKLLHARHPVNPKNGKPHLRTSLFPYREPFTIRLIPKRAKSLQKVYRERKQQAVSGPA